MEYWNIGVVEYWSNGLSKIHRQFPLPIILLFHYSITPSYLFHYSILVLFHYSVTPILHSFYVLFGWIGISIRNVDPLFTSLFAEISP